MSRGPSAQLFECRGRGGVVLGLGFYPDHSSVGVNKKNTLNGLNYFKSLQKRLKSGAGASRTGRQRTVDDRHHGPRRGPNKKSGLI